MSRGLWDFTDTELAMADALTKASVSEGIGDVRLEACEVVACLKDLGWEVSRICSAPLPDVAPARGQRTSYMAAESIDNVNERQWAVYCTLQEWGPLTDEQIETHYGYNRRGPVPEVVAQSPQSLRTRRAELTKAGHVEFTGLYRPTRSGRQAMVWASR